jgi:hypothetical protein
MTIPISAAAQILYTNERGFDFLANVHNVPEKRRVREPHDRNKTTNVLDVRVFREDNSSWLEFGIKHSVKRRPRTWRFEGEPGADPFKPETAADRVERHKKIVEKEQQKKPRSRRPEKKNSLHLYQLEKPKGIFDDHGKS